MSYYNPDNLKSANDPTIPFKPFRLAFTTAQIKRDTLLEFNMLYKQVTIFNNDAVNSLTVRKEASSETITIPPSTAASIPEWGSYLEVNPNAVTGSGLIEFDLVTQENAAQRGKK